MNRQKWDSFLQEVFAPVWFGDRPCVDVQLISRDDYPVLYKLKELSLNELAMLCWLIQFDTNFEKQGTWVPIYDITEDFEELGYEEQELVDAICALLNRQWVEMIVVDNHTKVRINPAILHKEGILESEYDSIFNSSTPEKNKLYAGSQQN